MNKLLMSCPPTKQANTNKKAINISTIPMASYKQTTKIFTETQRLGCLKMVMSESNVIEKINKQIGVNNAINVGQYLAGNKKGKFESPYLASGLQDEIKTRQMMTPELWCQKVDIMLYDIQEKKTPNLQDYLMFVRFLNTYKIPYNRSTCEGTLLLVGISRKIENLERQLFGNILKNFNKYCKEPFGQSFTPSRVSQFEREYSQVMYNIVGKSPKFLKGWGWQSYSQTCKCILTSVKTYETKTETSKSETENT